MKVQDEFGSAGDSRRLRHYPHRKNRTEGYNGLITVNEVGAISLETAARKK